MLRVKEEVSKCPWLSLLVSNTRKVVTYESRKVVTYESRQTKDYGVSYMTRDVDMLTMIFD